MLLTSTALFGGWIGAAAPAHAFQPSSTWIGNLTPTAEWNDGGNWDPSTVPIDTAIFDGVTATPTIGFGEFGPPATVGIQTIQFNAGAQQYTFEICNCSELDITGKGIVNASSSPPIFSVGGLLVFSNASTAGNSLITNDGFGETDFLDTSSAGTAIITNQNGGTTAFGSPGGIDTSTAGNSIITNRSGGSTFFQAFTSAGNASITNRFGSGTLFEDNSSAGSAMIVNRFGGETDFYDSSTAANANITNRFGGTTIFNFNSTAGNATITNNSFGSNEPFGLAFFDASTAGNAIIINNNNGFIWFGNPFGIDTPTAGNATIVNNSGGEIDFNAFSTAGNATITTNSGASTIFFDNSTGGLARFIVNGSGVLDFSATIGPNSDNQISAGSIEGDGIVYIGGGNTLSVGGNNLSTTFSGVLVDFNPCGCGPAGPGALNKVGTGTLILAGANTYTGGTTISGGTLQLGNGGSTGSIIGDVADNGVLAFNHSDTFTFGGLISGSGQVTQLGPGTLILSNANTYSGGTTVAGGVLSMGADNNIGSGPLALLNGSGLSFSNSFTFTHPITVAGDPTFDTSTGISVTMAGVIADGAQPGDLVKTGGGSLVLAAANTYTGGTVVNAGILQLGAGGSLAPTGALTVNAGGTFDLNGHTQTVGDFSGAGLVKLGSGALTAGASNSTTFSGVMSETGSFTKAGSGTLTLTGTNSYTGATNVAAGSLIVNGSISSSSLLTIMNGGLVGGTGVLPSTIVGSGGTLSPGNSIGTISVAGSLTFSTASVYLVEVSPTAADRTNVTAIALLKGNVQASFAPGSYSQRSYTILSAAGGLSGTFDTLTASNAPNYFSTSLGYTPTDVALNLTLGLGKVAGLNANQANVGTAIDSAFNTGGGLTSDFLSLLALPAASLFLAR